MNPFVNPIRRTWNWMGLLLFCCIAATLASGCAGPEKLKKPYLTTYYDRNQDGMVDSERHDIPGSASAAVTKSQGGGAAFFETEPVSPPTRMHQHVSCIVECPNGDLLVSWNRGTSERAPE